mgnify:CR=1 FL=1
MNKAVFLDRDGVVNEVLTNRVHFVNKPEDFYLLDGVGEAVALLNRSGFQVFVVTNQGGIGLGYMSEKMLHKIHDKMVREIGRKGGRITDIKYCPHAPKERCSCRKPNPKMILDLAEQYQVDLKKSYMIGDRDVDLIAGKKAGVRTVLIGGCDPAADFCFPVLLDAVRFIVGKN